MMDFVAKLAHPGVRRVAEDIVEGAHTSAPAVIEVDPTTTCNYSCYGCISANLLNHGEMPPKELSALIAEAAALGTSAIIFIGGGEPLAHSAMPKPLRQAHQLGMGVGLTTSGYFIGRHLETLQACVDWTRVSVDAASDITYKQVRPNRDSQAFSKVIRGIEALADGAYGEVGYSFLVMPEAAPVQNWQEIYQAAELAKNLGCDYFELKPFVDAAHRLIPSSKRRADELYSTWSEIKSLQSANFRIIGANSLLSSLERDVSQPKDYRTCPTTEMRTVVTPTRYYPCPYKRGMPDNSWERTGSLAEDWERGRPKRKAIDPSVDCSFHCIRDSLNLALLAGQLGPSASRNEVDPFV